MKNNLKNALNALGLLVFMALAWATSKADITEPINMEVKVNSDSTAFLLKNLDDIDYSNGSVRVWADTSRVGIAFDLDSVNIKAKAIDTLAFSSLTNSTTGLAFSKKNKLKEIYFYVSPHPAKKRATGVFNFNF